MLQLGASAQSSIIPLGFHTPWLKSIVVITDYNKDQNLAKRYLHVEDKGIN